MKTLVKILVLSPVWEHLVLQYAGVVHNIDMLNSHTWHLTQKYSADRVDQWSVAADYIEFQLFILLSYDFYPQLLQEKIIFRYWLTNRQ